MAPNRTGGVPSMRKIQLRPALRSVYTQRERERVRREHERDRDF